MLKPCSEQALISYMDFVYSLALDPSKSGYPIFNDGIKTKELFTTLAKDSFSKEQEDILLFEYNGVVEGWIQYEWIPVDRYLATTGFYIATHMEQALQEFLDFAQRQFRGYDLFLGFPGANETAVRFLSSHGFECIEDTFHHTLSLEQYQPVSGIKDVVRINEDNYELFAELHDQIEGYMYWNSPRIYETLDRWIVFVKLEDGKPVGNVYFKAAVDGIYSIYGVDLLDNIFRPQAFLDLMHSSLRTVTELGGKYVISFCEKEKVPSMRELGFHYVGEYIAFQRRLS